MTPGLFTARVRIAAALALAGATLAACTVMNGLTIPVEPVDGGGDAAEADYAAAILASRPLAYYRLDETAGMTAKDATGNGRDCTYVGGVQLGAAGILPGDTAVRFPSSPGNGVVCNDKDAFAFQGSKPFTIEGWYAPDALDGNYRDGFSRMDGSKTGYYGFFRAGQGFALQVFDSATFVCGVESNSFPCAGGGACGGYLNVVVTWDGANLIAYVDGQASAMPCPPGLLSSMGTPFALGNLSLLTCDSCGFAGAIDEVAIYDRALPASEIANHYALARP